MCYVYAVMSTLQSAPNLNSQSVPEENSQPSSTSELQSNTAGNTQTSGHEPDVVIINDQNEDKELKRARVKFGIILTE